MLSFSDAWLGHSSNRTDSKAQPTCGLRGLVPGSANHIAPATAPFVAAYVVHVSGTLSNSTPLHGLSHYTTIFTGYLGKFGRRLTGVNMCCGVGASGILDSAAWRLQQGRSRRMCFVKQDAIVYGRESEATTKRDRCNLWGQLL